MLSFVPEKSVFNPLIFVMKCLSEVEVIHVCVCVCVSYMYVSGMRVAAWAGERSSQLLKAFVSE